MVARARSAAGRSRSASRHSLNVPERNIVLLGGHSHENASSNADGGAGSAPREPDI
jgi:hypothetical protein